MNRIKERIKNDEGYAGEVYLDSVSVPSCGYGHALHVGSKISGEIADLFFEADFSNALMHTMNFINKHNLEHLNTARRCLLIDMVYNLGYNGLSKFKRFIKAMQDKDYDRASAEMLDSKWARQVKGRANRLANIMRIGEE